MIHKLKWIFVLILSKFLGEDIKIKYFRKSGIIIGRGLELSRNVQSKNTQNLG